MTPLRLLLLLFPTLAVGQSCQSLSEPVQIGGDVTLAHGVNPDEDTITIQVRYTGGQSYVGIGINTDGRDKMTPARAVIGRGDYEDGSTTVLKYDVTSDAKDGSGVQPVADQSDLQEASFVQTDEESVLTFTLPLDNPEFVTIENDSTWLYVVGLANNVWEGKHKIHGAIDVALTECGTGEAVTVQDSTEEPTTEEPESSTEEPTTEEPEPAEPVFPPPPAFVADPECPLSEPMSIGKSVTVQHAIDSSAGTFTMQVRYEDGHSYVGVGINEEGFVQMAPAKAIIGRMMPDGTSTVLQYDMTSDAKDASGVQPLASQNIIAASFEQTDDMVSILTFTTAVSDPLFWNINPGSAWIYAVGLADNAWEGKHKIHGAIDLTEFHECGTILAEPTTSPTLEPTAAETAAETAVASAAETTTGTTEGTGAGPDEGTGEATTSPTGAPVVPETSLPEDADDTTVTTTSEEEEMDSPNLDCTLVGPFDIHNSGTVLLSQIANLHAGTYTMKIEYTGGRSYIGIGINTEGQNKMAPAYAVIGRGFDDESTSVLKYRLRSDAEDGSGVQPLADDLQDLQDASFVQTDESSILTFTQKIEDPEFVTATDDSVWVFAVGLENNAWEGKHTIHGAFSLPMSDFVCKEIPATPAPVPAPLPVTPENGTNTTGANPVTNSSSEGSPPVESTPTDDTDAAPAPTTAATDTEEGDGAAGDRGQADSSLGLTFLDTTHPNRTLWMVHGILLALAWGVFAPLGIGAAIVRKGFDRLNCAPGTWYSVHFYANLLTVLLTIAGFIVGVVATNSEGESHWKGNHHKAGMAILIVAVIQGAGGYLRPGLPKPAKALKEESSDNTKSLPGTPATRDASPPATPDSGDANPPATPTKEDLIAQSPVVAAPQKSTLRYVWEYSHRLIGMGLVGLAWYNCHSGIELQVENWVDDVTDWTPIFWGVTGGICGVIFLIAYVVRV